MQTYDILVRGRSIIPGSNDMTLVRTSAGVDRVRVMFDSSEWRGFPVTITFSNGSAKVTQSMSLTQTSGEWDSYAYAIIPFEVMQSVGFVRVTLQGTDSSGNHIITAFGEPLTVEEAGDTVGHEPSETPTMSQWEQAYANAMIAAENANSVASELGSRLDDMVSEAQSSLDSAIASVTTPATETTLGLVKVGEGLGITEDGEVFCTALEGLTNEQKSQLANLAALAYYCFDTTFDGDGNLEEGATVKNSALPVATLTRPGMVMPDGTSVIVNADTGLMTFVGTLVHEWEGTVLKVTDKNGTTETDLVGPQGPAGQITSATASVDGTIGTPSVSVSLGGTPEQRTVSFEFSGLKGETGERGPSGYVLTQQDESDIADLILSRMANGDGVSY